jgi:plastocyanin
MKQLILTLTVTGLVGLFQTAQAKEVEVTQKNRKFGPAKLVVKVGETVSFKNEDPFFHNVYSLSDAKTFDLGSYPQGQAKNVTFDKPGTAEVECAIHPEMKLDIKVEK